MNNRNRLPQSSQDVKVALYIRVSSQEQAKHGVSLGDQEQRLKLLAQINGWQIAAIYSDEGYSGGTDNRPELQRLLHDSKSGAFNLVAVTKLDRFFRNIRLTLNYIYELEQNSVAFIAHDDNIDTKQPGMAKMLLNMLASMAEFERERIGERIRDFRQHLASKGQWSSGRTPFGYRFNKDTKELIVDPLEAEAIRIIFSTYTENEIGLVRTAEVCNSKGLITPRMGRRKHTTWTQSAIRHVLTHPAYKGGPNENWPFNSPAIVKPDVWELVQRRLANNRHFRASEGHSPFQGLLRCGLCSHTLRQGYNHSTTKVWECPGRLKRLHLDGSPRCTLPRFNADTLTKWLIGHIAAIFSDQSTLEKYIQDTLKNLHKEKEALERKLKPIRTNVERVQEQMAKADTMFEIGRLANEDYRARIAGLRKRLRELELQTTQADPLLLGQLTDIETAIKYYQTIPDELELMVKVWPKYVDFPGFSERVRNDIRYIKDLAFVSDILSKDNWEGKRDFSYPMMPIEGITEYLRRFGLFAYIYPDKVEIKGAVRQTNITPDYRLDCCPQSQ